MNKHTYIAEFYEWDSESALPEDEQELLRSAYKALDNSYSPYSGFSVAAALKLESGKIIQGTNQENAAYPSGLCAERVALFYAGSQYPNDKITKIAIVARSADFSVDHPVAPCGACRQVMLEYRLKQDTEIKAILKGTKGKIYTLSDVSSLLPLYFHEEGLKKNPET